MRWWLVWRGTRCALVRTKLASEARSQGAEMLSRYGASRDTARYLVVRRANAADVARFHAAWDQTKAGAGACRRVA